MKLSLRTRLVGAIVGAVVLIFLSSLIAARAVLARDLYELGKTEVASEASAFGGYLTARKDQIRLLVAQEAGSSVVRAALQSRDVARLRAELADTAGASGLSLLTITDARGRVIARAHTTAGGTLARDPLVIRALNGETVNTAALLPSSLLQSEGLALQIGRQQHGLALVTVAPISDEQLRTIGVIYGGVLLNHEYDLVDQATRAVGGASALLDGDTIVSSSIQAADGTRFVDARVPVADAVIDGGRPFVGADSEGGTLYLARIDPILDDQNRIVGATWYGLPIAQITDITKHTTETLVLWGVLAMILVLALAIPIAQTLSKTLVQHSRKVSETAKDLGVLIVGSEVSGDHVSATRRAVERSGALIEEMSKNADAPAKIDELKKLNAEVESDVTVIETLATEMSNRMQQAVDRVAELNDIAAGLNEIVTGESGS
ncbi:MAG TPA: cache domain-containing protein [Candidatus Tyrphobacter sp.]